MLLRHIRYLLAVVEQGNFTRAAETLYVSQPTLSQQIRQLEETLGAQLLDRSGRVVRATDAGEAYIAYARRALRELEAGQRAIHDVRDLVRGTLRLAMTPSLTSYLAGPLIARFNASYPGITLQVIEKTLDAIETALAADQVDLGLAFSQVRSTEINSQPLFDEKLCAVVGLAHPLAQRATATLAAAVLTAGELGRQSLALLSSDFATRSFVDAYLQQQGIAPKIAVEANTISAIVEIVCRGGLVTILPEAIAREHPGLQEIQLDPALPHRTVSLLRRKDGYQSAAARAFAELAGSLASAE
ncbi:transcriptional regulator CynR [Collimonas pratensis]|uniref:HTH-type transcriptional regulator CynR n=1 Tax=Collimonas pratensis TaxID=279113 RepID=A0A127QA40_9BURK|nr:transcriptional regulator CynR [Collimonas pratensis]AMP06856.1 HTH-type transcriptional regulator CynR [Collimonas pratensis]